MKCSKFLTSFLLIVFCCFKVAAQDSEYVYRDSASLTTDSIVTRSMKIDTKNSQVPDTNSDSLLYDHQLAAAADSAEALKNASSFSYAKNLDSLLMALQKKQQTSEPVAVHSTSWLEKFFFSPIVKVFFWTLAVLFVGFVLHRLFFTEGFFQRNSYTSKVTAIIEKPEENFAAADYSKLINEAIADKNYRMAVRCNYLQTLQKLAIKNVITFAPAKTNSQYIREVFNQPYKNEFAALTLQYEYAWYGGFELDERLFGRIQNNFKQFNSQL
ncbi:MAG: hypothetical protein JWR61_3163 [Ferruginibacter sp.]|uniref:DUF4129 domain-containing protein n=1 Tax=Ferruginibacter sp. TaxID=1940288 RepID=UPI00265A59C9|nr:DUF4129 domain-containing protein [Ferruginibacter sp.]MDB5278208.1 hypothetical protein [Ferruginibacter sp.]